MVKMWPLLFHSFVFPLPDLPAIICPERLQEVVAHFGLLKWLIERCTGVFRYLVDH